MSDTGDTISDQGETTIGSNIQYTLIPGRSSTYYSYSPSESDTDAKFYLAIPVDYISTIQEYLKLAHESLPVFSDPNKSEWHQYTYLCPTVMLDVGVLHLLSAEVADMLTEHALSVSERACGLSSWSSRLMETVMATRSWIR